MAFVRIDKRELIGQPTDVLIDVDAVEAVVTNTIAGSSNFNVSFRLAGGHMLPLQTADPDKIIDLIEAG